jgi:hypothetical protein
MTELTPEEQARVEAIVAGTLDPGDLRGAELLARHPKAVADGQAIEYELARRRAARTQDEAPPEGAGDGWSGESLPLRRELPPADPFPLDALPLVLRGAADQMFEAIRTPAAMVGSSLLAASALAVQAHADVEIDGRASPVSLYFSTIASSGERKTGVDDAALAPHRKREKDLRRAFEADVDSFAADHAAWAKSRDEALKRAGGRGAKRQALEELGPEPMAPVDPLLMMQEPTYEGLVKHLAHGWPSMGLFSDEGGRLLAGHAWNKDNKIKSAVGLSELWQGKPITRVRGEDGTSVLYGRRLSLHLMFQPPLLPLLFGDEMLTGQGFTARLLICYPESTIGTRLYRELDLNGAPEMRRYFAHTMGILEAPLPLAAGTVNELNPRRLPLGPSAKPTWVAFHDHVETLQRPHGELAGVRAEASKTAEQAARLAGVLTLIDDLDAGQVSLPHLEAGIELAQFYLGEAIRVRLSTGDNPAIVLAEKVLTWGAGSLRRLSTSGGRNGCVTRPARCTSSRSSPTMDWRGDSAQGPWLMGSRERTRGRCGRDFHSLPDPALESQE